MQLKVLERSVRREPAQPPPSTYLRHFLKIDQAMLSVRTFSKTTLDFWKKFIKVRINLVTPYSKYGEYLSAYSFPYLFCQHFENRFDIDMF